MGSAVTVDTSVLRQRLASLRSTEIPTAMRNVINDVAFDTRKRMVEQIEAIFNRPTPIVKKVPRVLRKATKTNPTAELWLSDYFAGKGGIDVANALFHHMTGGPRTRKRKGMERWLEIQGFITSSEWLVPSRSLKLDSYGNVPGHLAQKMLADVGAFRGAAGFTATTSKRKRKYFWLGGRAYGNRIKGIFTKQGGTLLPQMVVVSTTPRYAKRFRWDSIARTHAARVTGRFASREIAAAIGRRNR